MAVEERAEVTGLRLVPAGVRPNGDTWYEVDGIPPAPGGHRTCCSVFCRPSRLSQLVADAPTPPEFQIAVSPVLFLPRDSDRSVEGQQAAIYIAVAEYFADLAIAFGDAAVECSNVSNG